MSLTRATRYGFSALGALALVMLTAAPAWAQAAPPGPNAGNPEVTSAPAPEPAAPEPAQPASAGEPAPEPQATQAQGAAAAPEPPPLSISGHIEASYQIVVSDHKGQGSRPVPTRSFDGNARHSLLLNVAHVNLSREISDQVSGTVEFDAGSDAEVVSGGRLFDVQEAYLTYKPSAFSLTMGKFVTYEGIEVIEGPANPTVSRGYLFGLAEPYTHVGAKAHYTTGTFDLGIGMVNGWDTMVNDNGSMMAAFRVGATPSDAFGAGVSGYFAVGSDEGDADRDLISIDLTGSAQASEAVTFWFQANWGRLREPVGSATGNWFGVGLQPVYTSGRFVFGSRVEYFNDADGFRTGLADEASLLNVTVTPGYQVDGGLTLRVEYRVDTVLSGSVGGVGTKTLLEGKRSQHSVAVGAHVTF
ncbi:MAG: outer membrane beta-barrel protein [Acidobacteria bacterium]|nr:outer membrane beta-barrel protein [Acidobacteriota bacterium]